MLLLIVAIKAQTITQLNSNVSTTLNKIAFANSQIGVIVGSSGTILLTTDGGISFNKITAKNTSGSNITSQLNSICFANNTFHVVGMNGIYLRSTDMGQSWVQGPNFNQSKTLYGIYNFQNLLFATGNGGIYKSTDNGINWTKLRYGSGTKPVLRNFHFVNENKGYVTGMYGAVLRTNDGGITYDSLNVGNYDLFSLYFINENLGFVGGADGALFKTTDGGNSWNKLDIGTQGYIYNIYFADNFNGIITGSKGTLKRTTDGGNTWYNIPNTIITGSELFWGLHVIDNHNLLICGSNGQILKIEQAALPVELLDIDYKINNNKILLRWSTLTEINTNRYEIYRKE